MKRRHFLKYSGLLGGTGLMLNGFPISTFASKNMLSSLACNVGDRALIIIQLKGGNDGINNIIPLDQYDTYANIRPDIRLQQNALLNLDSTLSLANQVGLNPALSPFKSLYEQGKFSLVQGVSYPQNNKSHFKSTDLLLTAGDGTPEKFNIPSGWIGRYLDNRFPNFTGAPTNALPDPLGMQLGDTKPSIGFHTASEHNVDINLSGQDPSGYYNLVQSIGGSPINPIPNSEYGDELAFILNIENSVNAYAQRITSIFNAGSNSQVTYPDVSLANQLKTVARLLKGGSQTKVFLLQHGGFDTHANQTAAGDTTTGNHANLLSELTQSMQVFQTDLENLGLSDRVLTVTFSEFGRKAIQNGNNGTDHGTLAPMYIIGDNVAPGVIGTNINLSDLDDTGAPNISQIQHDYRQVFGTLVQDWMGGNDDSLTAAMLKQYSVEKLPLIKTESIVEPSCYINGETGTSDAVISLELLLEGFFDSSIGRMQTMLQANGLLPLNQPFNTAPWNHDGTEVWDDTLEEAVDWVLVVVRDSNDPATILAQQACILDEDGTLRNMAFESALRFNTLAVGSHYVSIYHKSHLPIISAAPVEFKSVSVETSQVMNYSFIEDPNSANGTEQLKKINVGGTDKYGMYCGDFNNDNQINDSDYQLWKQNGAKLDQYLSIDADGNGVVNNIDHNFWAKNKPKLSHPDLQ